MRSNRTIPFAAALSVGHIESAFASGDPAVLLVPIGHVVLSVVFLASLRSWPSWTHRLALSAVFFASLAAVYLATSGVPYADNSSWLVPAMLAVPLAVWGIAAVLLRRLLRHGRVA
jgi:hypothetical protein